MRACIRSVCRAWCVFWRILLAPPLELALLAERYCSTARRSCCLLRQAGPSNARSLLSLLPLRRRRIYKDHGAGPRHRTQSISIRRAADERQVQPIHLFNITVFLSYKINLAPDFSPVLLLSSGHGVFLNVDVDGVGTLLPPLLPFDNLKGDHFTMIRSRFLSPLPLSTDGFRHRWSCLYPPVSRLMLTYTDDTYLSYLHARLLLFSLLLLLLARVACVLACISHAGF